MMSQLTDDDVAYLRLGLSRGFAPESTAAARIEERHKRSEDKKTSKKQRAPRPKPTPRDVAFRNHLDAYHAFYAAHAAAPVPDPLPNEPLVPVGPRFSYADPGPLARAVLARRDAGVAMLHEPQYVVQRYLFGAIAVDCDADTRAALHAGEPELLLLLRSHIEMYYRRFGVDWEYYRRYCHPYAGGETSHVERRSWSQVRNGLLMRGDLDEFLGERTYEYDDDARFARWRQDPSTIDAQWAIDEIATGIAIGSCLAHEIERAEDVLLDTLHRHLSGARQGADITHITLLQDNENVRYQFYVLAGTDGVAFALRCWEL